MTSRPSRVRALLQTALDDGDLSREAFETLTVDADTGAQIQAALGAGPDDVPASEVVLLTLMPDDSGSIQFSGNAQAVRDGHNLVLESLAATRQASQVLAHTRYLNGHVLFPYVPLAQAIRLDTSNYRADKGTPLYDQIAVLAGTVLAKTAEFERAGVPVRSVTLIITDGADECSTRHSPKTLRPLITDLLRKESHIVAAMGIDNGSTDFRKVFAEIGIPDRWVLTPRSTRDEIRRSFQVFSQSAVRLSQGGLRATGQSLGGFLN